MARFSCAYLDKSELDLNKLNEKAKKVELKKIAKRLGISAGTVSIYLSEVEKYSHIKVPKDFVDAILLKAKETQQKNEEIVKSLNEQINSF
jgi:predicted transcriptional regulator